MHFIYIEREFYVELSQTWYTWYNYTKTCIQHGDRNRHWEFPFLFIFFSLSPRCSSKTKCLTCISPSSILNKSRVGHADSAQLTQEALRVPGGVHGLDHTATDELPWNSAGWRKTLLNSRKRKPVWMCVQAIHMPATCLPVTHVLVTPVVVIHVPVILISVIHILITSPTPIPYIIIIPAICVSDTQSHNTPTGHI